MAQPQESLPAVQLNLHCLRTLLKEFLDPLRTGDALADFYNVYRRESENFDRDYVGRYSQDLDMTLLFAGLFAVVSATFVTSIQPKLEPDPNEVTVAYMQLLIHTMNNSLFPHADQNSVTPPSAKPPLQIVVVQAILYASLATSLLAAFLATLGRQWVNRYARNRRGSGAERGRKRQQKLDGLNDWHFNFVIECLPVMLQLALLLFGCALSIYLWTINNSVAWVMVAFILTGFALYAFFTTAAMFSPTCPYQTPFSIVIQALVRGTSAVYRLLRSTTAPWNLSRRQPRNRGRNPGALGDEESPQLRTVKLDDYHFGEISASPADRGDARCVSWVLDSAADDNVVFFGARFTVEITLYPEIAGILSPVVLANHLLSSALGRQAVSKRLERTSMIGMALASVLSVQLCMDPEREDLLNLSQDLRHYTDWISLSEPTVSPGVAILGIVLKNQGESVKDWGILSNIPGRLPTSQKLCLSRTILQTVWRWRRDDPTTIFHLESMGALCNRLMANGDHAIPALKTNCFLIMSICLGASADDVRKLFTPNTRDALLTAIAVFRRQLRGSIRNKITESQTMISILSTLASLDPLQASGTAKQGFEWISDILGSGYPQDGRHLMAIQVMRMIEKHLFPNDPDSPRRVQPTWVHSFLHFLSLFERQYIPDSSTCLRTIARCILSSPESAHLGIAIVPLLTSTLSPIHPFQSRCSALKAFYRTASGWFSRRDVPDIDLQDLLQAVGDPFQFALDPPLPNGQPVGATDYDSAMAIVALIEFASSDQWQDYIPGSVFASCEEFVSTLAGKEFFIDCLFEAAAAWPGFLDTDRKVTAVVAHLQGFGHQSMAEVINEWIRIARRVPGGDDSLSSGTSAHWYSQEGDGLTTEHSGIPETTLEEVGFFGSRR